MNLQFGISKLSLLGLCLVAFSATAQVAQLPDDTSSEPILAPTVESLQIEAMIRSENFQVPQMTESQQVELNAQYSYIDPLSTIPQNLKKSALAFFNANQKNFPNKKYITVVDFSAHSSLSRMFIIDMRTGAVLALHVAHGKGSDTNNDGYPERFSDVSGSQMSSVGYYRVSETYSGSHGLSIRLDGLSKTNSKVRSRAIVIHGASYVSDSNVKAGRSWGCFAIPMNDRNGVVAMLKGGSLLYAGLSH